MSRRITQRARCLLFDLGVRNARLDIHRRPLTRDQIGSAFKQWFVLQVIYLNRALQKGWTLSSYRGEAGAHVGAHDARGIHSLGETVRGHKPPRKRIAFQGPRSRILAGDVRADPFLEDVVIHPVGRPGCACAPEETRPAPGSHPGKRAGGPPPGRAARGDIRETTSCA